MRSEQNNPLNTCCLQADAPYVEADRELTTSRPPAWQSGFEGEPVAASASTDSTVLALLLGVMVLIGLSMKHVRHLFRNLPQDLFSVRRRGNIFDEHTANETWVVFLILLELWLMEGILLLLAFGNVDGSAGSIAMKVVCLMGLAGGLYLFQGAGSIVLGYTFSDSESAGLLRRGFNDAQMLLAVAITVPALVALFYPALSGAMLWTALGVYAISRICYLIQGFRIFYKNILSILYFILYLCTLEIIPVIAVCRAAAAICALSK